MRDQRIDPRAGGLVGRVAIVTGAGRGIGAATAGALALAGAAVTVTDVLDVEGEGVAAGLRHRGFQARYAHLDVTQGRDWDRVVAATVAGFGGLHVLVNNAGIDTEADLEAETPAGYERVVAVNQTGVWLGMKHAIPAMLACGGGSIVNISSIFGTVGGFGGSAAYHATKGAVRLMSKNVAIRYATAGIRVNSVHPGFVDTPMVAPLMGTAEGPLILANTPMARLGRPEEIASVVVFLAGDGASYMTGSEIHVDGGWTAR
ncbi:MAG: glucose 1-dehydrogenase [Acidimicrobiales bacterium]